MADRCSARRRTDGEPCQAWPVKGATVCYVHGGNAPQVREAARRNVAMQAARRKLTDVGVEPVGDPFVALEELTSEALTLRNVLAERVAAIEDEASAKPEDVRAHWRAYGEALDRAERFAKHLADLGLDERRVALSERLGGQVADVIRGALAAVFALLRDRLGEDASGVLDAVESEEVPRIVRAELLEVVRDGEGDGG